MNTTLLARSGPFKAAQRAFTLIELMITLAILAIIVALAYPSYVDYVIRGKLVDATNALASGRAQMEQYFQDNRTYLAVGNFTPPCATAQTFGLFNVVCAAPAPTATTYTITATGSGTVAGFIYTIDQSNNQTTRAPAPWPSGNCWLTKKGQAC
jgi:type IV pilus assembly protein PilE